MIDYDYMHYLAAMQNAKLDVLRDSAVITACAVYVVGELSGWAYRRTLSAWRRTGGRLVSRRRAKNQRKIAVQEAGSKPNVGNGINTQYQ